MFKTQDNKRQIWHKVDNFFVVSRYKGSNTQVYFNL